MSSADAVNLSNLRSWSRVADRYAGDEPRVEDPEMRARCRSLFAERLRGRRVLEIGCGPGNDSDELRRQGLDVTATDACEEFLAVVRERYPDLDVRRMDMSRPDLAPESFDGIYGFFSFIHLPRELAASTLRRLGELLSPEGVIFLALIRSTRLDDYVIEDWGECADNPMHFSCWDPEEFGRLLVEAGFTDVEVFEVKSPVYEDLPRLRERGVSGYQIAARRRPQPPASRDA